MKITEEDLIEKCETEGYYILSSKQVTNKYYNLVDLYCRNHNYVLDYYVERLEHYEFDTIVSPEFGGALIGSGLAERLNKNIAIYRKEKPNVGIPYKRCLIIEDVSTTGNSINIVKKWIADCNAIVVQAIVGIDRRKKKK